MDFEVNVRIFGESLEELSMRSHEVFSKHLSESIDEFLTNGSPKKSGAFKFVLSKRADLYRPGKFFYELTVKSTL